MPVSKSNRSGRVSLKELAARLDTSVCTISKALHNKPKVSEKMRAKVLALAEELGYAPNILARSMARRPLRIALVYPMAWPSYNQLLINGAIHRAEELRDFHISVKAFPFEGISETAGCIEAIAAAEAGKFDAMILSSTSAEVDASEDFSREVGRVSCPVLLLGGGRSPQAKLLCTVRQNSQRCGEIAGNLAQLLLPEGGSAAVIIGLASICDHHEKIKGFKAYLRQGTVAFAGHAETLDQADKAYSAAAELLKRHPQLSLLYVGTENISGVLAYLEEHNLARRIRVIATGTSAAVNEGLRNGNIQFAIDEEPLLQGQMAMDAVFRRLLLGQTLPPTILIAPTIRVKCQIENDPPAAVDSFARSLTLPLQ